MPTKTTTETKPIVHRFAHPFFETKKSDGKTMIDHIKDALEPFPKTKGSGIMKLQDIIGATGVKEIEKNKSITFQCVGDTGHENGQAQAAVADAMSKDFDINNPGKSPALFVHLGDVNYYNNTDSGYHGQFYEPYVHYPGKIIAIPGNHDGELFKFDGKSTGQKNSLDAFIANFCMKTSGVPSAAGTIFRQMYSQPGVYWLLQSPFVDIIGLYSNCAENPGFISGDVIGMEQKKWLDKTLQTIKVARTKSGTKKALVVATHHPPLSHSGHSGSKEMLADIDDSFTKAGMMYDLFLSAHAHNYQRFTRTIVFEGKNKKIPFLVVGTGGRGITPVTDADRKVTDDYSYDKSFKGYGYLNLNASTSKITATFISVDPESGEKNIFETVEVAL